MWFDPGVVQAVGEAIPTWLAVVIVLLSYLGSVYLIAPAMIAAYWRARELVAPWLGAIVGCYALMSITKSIHSVSRPAVDPPVGPDAFPAVLVPAYEHAALISTSSFPSGHALAATIVAGVIVYDLPVGTRTRRAVVGAAFVGWVGFTRIALGVHYPGDVVGGVAYGLAFLALYVGVRRWTETRAGDASFVADPTDRVRLRLDAPTGSFALGLVFAIGALAVSGSRNAHIVFGAAVGGLVAWTFAPTIAARIRETAAERVIPVVAVGVVLVTWFVAELGIGNNVFIVAWSALFLAMVVLVPWVSGGLRTRSVARTPQPSD